MDAALLLFLSKYNTRNTALQDYTGVLPNGAEICVPGFQTNDAPCHYLLRWAAAAGDKITRILCITSQEDIQPVPPEGTSSLQRFCDTVEKIRQADTVLQNLYGEKKIHIETIAYDYGENVDPLSVDLRTKELYRCITSRFSGVDAPPKIYIDYTGGPRDTTFLITELARFLEYSGIHCGCIAYSNLQEKRLVSLNNVYDMFRLLNAIHDFVAYGKANSLKAIYQDRGNRAVDHLLDSLTSFSEAMSLCALDNINDILERVRQAVEEMEAYAPRPEDDVAIRMLKDFLPQICEKLNLANTDDGIAELDLIRWCLTNGLLQQALILFTEKIPELCFRTALLEQSLIDDGFVPGQGKSRWVYGLYDNLFRQLRSMDEIGEFRQYLNAVLETKQTMKVSYPKSIVACAELECWSGSCREAIGRFVETVTLCYSAKDGTRTEGAQSVSFYGKKPTGKNVATFIKNVLEDEQTLHFFVYQDALAWQTARKPESKDLMKKMTALNYLRANPDLDVSAYTKVLTAAQLYTLLAGYFAVKMLRNHASHASGSAAPEICYCHAQGLIDAPCVSYQTVTKTLERMEVFLREQCLRT